MKKRFFSCLIIIMLVLSFTTCQTLSSMLREPAVSLHSVEIAGITITGTELLCKVRVENSNSFDIPFPEVGWELFINSNSFISGVVKNDQRIRARNTTFVEIPVNLQYLEIFNTFASLKGREQANYKVAFAIKINIPVLGDLTWNLEHEGQFPMLQMPKLARPSMSIARSDLSGVELLVSVNIENPNSFPIPSPIITYDYQVNRNSFIKGVVDSEGPLAASSVTPLNFRLIVNYVDLFRSFASLALQRNVSTSLNLSYDFAIPAFGSELFNFQLTDILPLR